MPCLAGGDHPTTSARPLPAHVTTHSKLSGSNRLHACFMHAWPHQPSGQVLSRWLPTLIILQGGRPPAPVVGKNFLGRAQQAAMHGAMYRQWTGQCSASMATRAARRPWPEASRPRAGPQPSPEGSTTTPYCSSSTTLPQQQYPPAVPHSRLDGEGLPLPHHPLGLVVRVVWDVGRAVEQVADAVPAVGLHHAEAAGGSRWGGTGRGGRMSWERAAHMNEAGWGA